MVSVECRGCRKKNNMSTDNILLSLTQNTTISKGIEEYIVDTDLNDYICEKYVKIPYKYNINK